MDMNGIPSGYAGEIDLHHLQVLDVLLREHSLTRAARLLNVTQPALSKTLARLRRYFGDPLFVRVSLRMEPTPKALALQPAIHAIIEQMRTLRSEHVPFDPKLTSRTFNFCVVESGTVDFAMGSFPGLIKGVRRQRLWTERYVSVARRGHPRLGKAPSAAAFAAEKHVLVSTAGTGHANQLAERAVEAAVPADNIVCRVPLFTAAAVVARHSDAIATLPASVASALADDLGLAILDPPIKLPRIEIYQYWHERFHRDPGNAWIRGVFARLFRGHSEAAA